MCLGETGNNQGDSFVYDGKNSKSKRKLLEGGINVFSPPFFPLLSVKIVLRNERNDREIRRRNVEYIDRTKGIKVLEWKQQKKKLGGFELKMILGVLKE